jgi:hypothetical protein
MKRLFLGTAAAMLAPPAHATDLMEAWQAAAAHDPDHLGAQAERDAGGEAAVQARALKRPSVQLQGGYNIMSQKPTPVSRKNWTGLYRKPIERPGDRWRAGGSAFV